MRVVPRRNGKSSIDRQIAAAIYGLIVGLLVGGGVALIGEPRILAVPCGLSGAAGAAIYILYFA
jgi:tetrahydromethanopterin S-methyltransferase subunit B